MDNEDRVPKLYKQKRATAADQFSYYQDEYEARGKPSSDKMQPVLNHNQTYPKLKKELDKRRSTGEVSDVKKNRLANNSRTSREKKTQTTQRMTQRARRPKKTTRVIEKRPKRPCKCRKCLPLKFIRKNLKSCQFTSFVTGINRRIETEPCKMASTPPQSSVSNTHNHPERDADASTAHYDLEIIFPPVSKTPSGSSFHSSLALDHEPMD